MKASLTLYNKIIYSNTIIVAIFHLVFCTVPNLTNAQNYPCHGVIVQYEGRDFGKSISDLQTSRTDITWRQIGKVTNTYLVNGQDCATIYDFCKNIPGIVALEYNRVTEKRTKPNDARVEEQYYLGLIKAYESWDITTGGTNFKGEDIVIAVIDDGYDLSHEDLLGNLYTNPDEIANDGKDNDGNGYIDDVRGWNTRTENGIQDEKSHGTYILGVLGASGNNAKGIAGINWTTKMLPITTGNLVSDVVEGYDYILAEKKAYNSSGGTKGSNILVSSYSGGISKAFASDFPVWCAIYDKLGKEGVLNVTAATNEDDNVDVVGDMPSTCTSPYLLVVNSTNKADEKDAITGYGVKSVDISAPGEKILTTETSTRGVYKLETGTSLSTPIVAGAAALLYSLKCEPFFDLVKSNPNEGALIVKEILIANVDKKSSLQGKSISEGRLNIYESIKAIQEKFDNCISIPSLKNPLKINSISHDGISLSVDYDSPDEKEMTFIIFDTAGKTIFTQKVIPPSFGDKMLYLIWEQEIPGIYFGSLISDKGAVSKGFNVKIGK